MLNSLIVGRATTAIYGILKCSNSNLRGILLPANICPAAIYGCIYAGFKPIFCDVDPISGNTTYELISKANFDNVQYALLPHMYGNPIGRFDDIVSFLHTKGIIVIEDCASAFGSVDGKGNVVGSFGDYSIFSFGYSKTISIGFGGMLKSSTYDLAPIKDELSSLHIFNDDIEQYEGTLSKIYRQIRNTRKQTPIEQELMRSIGKAFKPCYLYMLNPSQINTVKKAILALDNVREERKRQYNLYKEAFYNINSDFITLYPFEDGAVPWRFNFFVPEDLRQQIIDKALKENVPLSDWYPSAAGYFDLSKSFRGATKHGNSILNLPLMVSDSAIQSSCKKMKEILESM